jgi:hypothetical protein
MKNCPFCHKPLTVYYSQSREELVCYCPNPECKVTKGVVGTGDTVEFARNLFHGLCLKLEEVIK